MTTVNPRIQSYTLPGQESLANRNLQPVSVSNIGNLYTVAPGQAVPVSVESSQPRQVTLSNVGSIPLIVSDSQRTFPYGTRLPSGDELQLITSSALWVAAPPTVRLTASVPGIVISFAYVSVSIAI